MTTHLFAQFNLNKNKVMLAMPEYYQALKTKIESRINIKQGLFDDNDSGTTTVPYQKINDIAVINFQGFTISDCTEIEAYYFGLVSLQGFCDDLQQAVDDASISAIVINFNSGGGYTTYGDETCELVKQLSTVKPIYAYCGGGYMCSMAYKIASNCTNVIASPSAIIGSIGTYCEYATYIGASQLGKDGITESTLPDQGYVVTTFQGGTEKTVGSNYIALSQEQKQSIMDDINNLTLEFKAMVIANRGNVNDAFMQGQSFTGKESIEQGTNLIDGTINSLNQFVQFISTNK